MRFWLKGVDGCGSSNSSGSFAPLRMTAVLNFEDAEGTFFAARTRNAGPSTSLRFAQDDNYIVNKYK